MNLEFLFTCTWGHSIAGCATVIILHQEYKDQIIEKTNELIRNTLFMLQALKIALPDSS